MEGSIKYKQIFEPLKGRIPWKYFYREDKTMHIGSLSHIGFLSQLWRGRETLFIEQYIFFLPVFCWARVQFVLFQLEIGTDYWWFIKDPEGILSKLQFITLRKTKQGTLLQGTFCATHEVYLGKTDDY